MSTTTEIGNNVKTRESMPANAADFLDFEIHQC